MYYTHGDAVVYRSNSRQEPKRKRRERPPEAQREERPAEPSREEQLAERLAQLEARLERVEAGLEEARKAPPAPAPRSGGRRSGKGGGDVKVSLQADSGAQATVGQVRMVSQE